MPACVLALRVRSFAVCSECCASAALHRCRGGIAANFCVRRGCGTRIVRVFHVFVVGFNFSVGCLVSLRVGLRAVLSRISAKSATFCV